MIRPDVLAKACIVAAIAAAPLVSMAQLSSTFDAGTDGWSVDSNQGTAGVSNFQWLATGGNPGGHIQAVDIGDQGGWWFVAPATWAGDWTGYLGGNIHFDVLASQGQDTVLNPPVSAIVLGLEDGGRLRSIASAGAVLNQWVAVDVGLSADQFALTDSGYASFDEALRHVTFMVIPGDFVYRQLDSAKLDNVLVTPVPEPSTWALMAAGLVALGVMRRVSRCSATIDRAVACSPGRS